MGRVKLFWSADDANPSNTHDLGVVWKYVDLQSKYYCSHPWLKNQGMLTIVENEFQS